MNKHLIYRLIMYISSKIKEVPIINYRETN